MPLPNTVPTYHIHYKIPMIPNLSLLYFEMTKNFLTYVILFRRVRVRAESKKYVATIRDLPPSVGFSEG